MPSLFAVLLAVALAFAGLARPLRAQDAGGLTLEASAGFDGHYRPGEPLPVIVRAANSGPAFEGEIQVIVTGASSAEPVIYTAPLSLPIQSDKRVPIYIHLPSFGSAIDVRLVEDGQVAAVAQANPVNQLPADNLLYGLISPDPGALAYLEAVPGERADAQVATLTVEDLPAVSAVLNALDVLVMDDTDTTRLSTGQLAALRAWVETGGTLVVTGGAGGPQTVAGLADLLPVVVTGTKTFEELPALEALGEPFSSAGPYLLTVGEATTGADILLEADGAVLLALGAVGQGRVYFLALDPKSAPLSGWNGTRVLWERITAGVPVPTPWAGGIRDGFAASSAVGSVPGLQLPAVWQLGLYGLVYALIIGPVNYLILKRLNRREWAWVTIPVLVLFFSALTLLTSFRSRGNALVVNQMSLAQGPIGGALRAETVLGLYSPRRGQFDMTLPLTTVPQPFTEGFGSINSTNNLDAIDRGSSVALRGIRAGSSALASFLVDGTQQSPTLSATAVLSQASDEIAIEVRNDDTFSLENATLVVGAEQHSLGTLEPGESVAVTIPLLAAPSVPAGVTPTPDPFLLPGAAVVDPLLNDPTVILGTTDYFGDTAAYARYQLLQSLYSGENNPSRLPNPTEAITLAGWRSGSALETDLTGTSDVTTSGSTLYLLLIPVERTAP